MLIKLITHKTLSTYHISETHTISWIGKIENPNVTILSQKMALTKGALSKILKKLKSKGLVTSYKIESNKKEIYYKLTPKGEKVYTEHEIRHEKSDLRDLQFFMKLELEEFESISAFLKKFNLYLDNLLEHNGEEEKNQTKKQHII